MDVYAHSRPTFDVNFFLYVQFVYQLLRESRFYYPGENRCLCLPSVHGTTHVAMCVRVNSRCGSYVLCGPQCLTTWLSLIHLCILN